MLAILLYPKSLISRAIGPNTRVPFGNFSFKFSKTTPALSSNRITEPSTRRVSFLVRTITTNTFSCSFTEPTGEAFLTMQRTTSPTRAIFKLPLPGMPITCNIFAPELSAAFIFDLSCNMVVLLLLCNFKSLVFTHWSCLLNLNHISIFKLHSLNMCFIFFAARNSLFVNGMLYGTHHRHYYCLIHFGRYDGTGKKFTHAYHLLPLLLEFAVL